MKKVTLNQVDYHKYVSRRGVVVMRRVPEIWDKGGNLHHYKWGLFRHGYLIDFDKFRNDLAQRNNVTLSEELFVGENA